MATVLSSVQFSSRPKTLMNIVFALNTRVVHWHCFIPNNFFLFQKWRSRFDRLASSTCSGHMKRAPAYVMAAMGDLSPSSTPDSRMRHHRRAFSPVNHNDPSHSHTKCCRTLTRSRRYKNSTCASNLNNTTDNSPVIVLRDPVFSDFSSSPSSFIPRATDNRCSDSAPSVNGSSLLPYPNISPITSERSSHSTSGAKKRMRAYSWYSAPSRQKAASACGFACLLLLCFVPVVLGITSLRGSWM